MSKHIINLVDTNTLDTDFVDGEHDNESNMHKDANDSDSQPSEPGSSESISESDDIDQGKPQESNSQSQEIIEEQDIDISQDQQYHDNIQNQSELQHNDNHHQQMLVKQEDSIGVLNNVPSNALSSVKLEKQDDIPLEEVKNDTQSTVSLPQQLDTVSVGTNVSVSNIKIVPLTEDQYSEDSESMDSEDDNIMTKNQQLEEHSKWTISMFTNSLINLFIGTDDPDHASIRLKQEYMKIKKIVQDSANADYEMSMQDLLLIQNAKMYAHLTFALQKLSLCCLLLSVCTFTQICHHV